VSELTHPVVVGVDGTEANLGAVLFAVEEASRRAAPLRLVHVVPDRVAVSPLVPATPVDLSDTGEVILRRAERQVRGVAPDLLVEARLRHGNRAAQLARSAQESTTLVVGRDDRPAVERLLRGDTATAVASHAAVPVVEVPADWRPPGPDRTSRGTVVVGLKSPVYADAVLADAFERARERSADLVVVHAWKLPSGYDEVVDGHGELDEWERTATRELEALLASWRAAYPEVAVATRVVHEHPAQALVHASEEADLVVVLRHAHGSPSTSHLGSVARAVLRSSDCPVRVVPPTEAGAIPDLVLEAAGGLLA